MATTASATTSARNADAGIGKNKAALTMNRNERRLSNAHRLKRNFDRNERASLLREPLHGRKRFPSHVLSSTSV